MAVKTFGFYRHQQQRCSLMSTCELSQTQYLKIMMGTDKATPYFLTHLVKNLKLPVEVSKVEGMKNDQNVLDTLEPAFAHCYIYLPSLLRWLTFVGISSRASLLSPCTNQYLMWTSITNFNLIQLFLLKMELFLFPN